MRWLRWPLRILGVLAVLWLYLATLHPHERVEEHPYFAKPGAWAIAHRGGRGLWPENTLFALERAHALGVDVLEMDLRVTADGVIVVMHDGRVDRTTNGTGRVDSMALASLRQLDAGYRFRDPAGEFPYRGRGIVVPLFEEVLARFPTALLNVEMKDFAPEQAERLCSMLQSHGAGARVLVASAGHSAVAAFRRRCPNVATSVTFPEGLALYALYRLRIPSLYRGPAVAIETPEYLGRRHVLEPGLLTLARDYNLRMQVWTVNEESDMRRMLQLGVQGILTDYPDRLLRVLGRSSAPPSTPIGSGRVPPAAAATPKQFRTVVF